MPKLGEQPTSINRERFDKNEENSENIKKQLHEAMASGDADKIIELGGQMKNLKAQKEKFKGQDEGEAYEENAKIKDHEDANEMNKQFDETKVAEEAAKEKARIAEETRIQAENEAAQLAAVRAKINGEGSEENITNEKQKPPFDGDTVKVMKTEESEEAQNKLKDIFSIALNEELVAMEQSGRLTPEQAEEKRKDAALIETGFSDNPKNDALLFSRAGVAKKEELIEILNKKKNEAIYGMNLNELAEIIKKQGYPEIPTKVGDPQFKEKMDKFNADRSAFMQARVKLFDRVLAGKASEEEMKIAMGHAAEQAKSYGLEGFNSAVPKNWYTNERLLEAMAATSPQNAKFIEYVKKNVPKEKLANYFEKIDNDGQVRTYERTA